MVFSKAIQVKLLVNRLNNNRRCGDYGYIAFKCTMYSLGHWSVQLKPVDSKLFFSEELEQLITLYAGGGFLMMVSSMNDVPYIDMQ